MGAGQAGFRDRTARAREGGSEASGRGTCWWQEGDGAGSGGLTGVWVGKRWIGRRDGVLEGAVDGRRELAVGRAGAARRESGGSSASPPELGRRRRPASRLSPSQPAIRRIVISNQPPPPSTTPSMLRLPLLPQSCLRLASAIQAVPLLAPARSASSSSSSSAWRALAAARPRPSPAAAAARPTPGSSSRSSLALLLPRRPSSTTVRCRPLACPACPTDRGLTRGPRTRRRTLRRLPESARSAGQPRHRRRRRRPPSSRLQRRYPRRLPRPSPNPVPCVLPLCHPPCCRR